ncbi:MAG: hypothetical protein ABEI86_05490, partial [Halobacteriaceae archaeon]
MSQSKGGILTESQREFLKGNSVPNSYSGRSNARSRIREQVRNAFQDFEILCEHWDPEEAKKT